MTAVVEPGTEPRVLRYYQVEAADAVEADWESGTPRVGVVLPTGVGKSSVAAEIAVRAYRRGQRTVMLAHRAELIEQMTSTVFAIDPSIPASDVGIVRAEFDESDAPIVGATLQTLGSAHRRQALGRRDVIIWDEVHHAGAESWHATFEDLGGYDDAYMMGLTATMHREPGRGGTKSGRVIGLGDVMQKISYEKDLRWAIRERFLVPPRGLTVRIENLNALNDVRNVAGDFHQGQLAEIMEAATEYVVDAIELHAKDRRPIVFAASVAAAYQITDALNDRGLSAEYTVGINAYEQRQETYARFRSGQTQILVTVMVLTEGADFPMCDSVVLARPTRSRNLYSQMIGRSMRLHPGKTDALVLDLSGSTRQMRLVNLSTLDQGFEITEVDQDGELIEEDDPQEFVEPQQRPTRQGPVDMEHINLLDGDDTLWLETTAGVPFLAFHDKNNIFLWPEGSRKGAERYAVGFINTQTRKVLTHPAGQVYRPLSEALELAQDWAVECGQTLPSRNASWRQGLRAPSEGQLRYARTLQILNADQMAKNRLSDEISIALMSRALDHLMEG